MFPENNKQIIQHYELSLYWIKSLSDISEVQWRMPIEPGKWSVAEVIGHLSPWDEFVLNHRIPFFFVKKCLPKGPDVAWMNTIAAKKSREQSMEETIKNFIATRSQLLQAVQSFSDEQWQQLFTVGQSEITVIAYFIGLVNHDLHHFSQVQNVIHV
ncbi:DinB family protein [Lysinibacillus sp. NPDC098008]|uniref:DinB family protein n=1 Tax=Lysinibacillus sp. NPDC098008 TaxID=3364146 RepID=UPI003809989E